MSLTSMSSLMLPIPFLTVGNIIVAIDIAVPVILSFQKAMIALPDGTILEEVSQTTCGADAFLVQRVRAALRVMTRGRLQFLSEMKKCSVPVRPLLAFLFCNHDECMCGNLVVLKVSNLSAYEVRVR